MSMALKKLLGSYLLRNGKEKVLVENFPPQLVIGLYFTDQFPSDCENFGTSLHLFLEKVQARDCLRPFEVIWIQATVGRESSSDSNEPCAHHYTSFLTLAGDTKRLKEEFLIQKYGLHETGTLILMDAATTDVVCWKGREKVLGDPEALNFPYFPRPYSAILDAGPFVNYSSNPLDETSNNDPKSTRPLSPELALEESKFLAGRNDPKRVSNADDNGKNSQTSILHSSQALSPPKDTFTRSDPRKNRIKGFFFGAYWCPPCRLLNNALKELFTKVRDQGWNFQVIFVSSDRSKESFENFLRTMPWPAVPFEEDSRREELRDYFNVKAIPSLIIVDDEEGRIITREGRLEMSEDLEAVDFPWYPKLVQELRDRHSYTLNSRICILYFLGEEEDEEGGELEKAEAVLEQIAKKYADLDMEQVLEPRFFIGCDSDLSDSLRFFLDFEVSCSNIVILDVRNLRYFILPQPSSDNPWDEQNIYKYIQRFLNSQLKYSFIHGILNAEPGAPPLVC